MFKTVLIVVLAVIAVVAVAIAGLFANVWWQARKQPPAFALIVEKYYACPDQRALHGGIFGKGPTKVLFPAGARQWCWRDEWKEIDRAEFRRLASQWHGVDWSQEGEWWTRE
ncbi:hypothetical protein [Pseudoxanthomonas koreensis]|uniref:hypothetical protein n=1 Tax=Pseudoxanthomonas koreensis TaxID=266061 RepID=UPI0035A70718